MMGDTRFSPEGKLIIGLRKAGIIMGRANFMMGGILFSPEGKLLIGLRKAGYYYGEGQFHDGRHPVLSRRKVDHWAEKSRILLWGGPIS